MNPTKTINFIGIGAQKAGTTWLYSRLSELPEFSLTPQKEVHYFDRSISYPSPNILSKTDLANRVFSLAWLFRAIGKPLQQLIKGDLTSFKWYLNYYYSNYNDNWYKSLFFSLKGKKGEITPSYSILKKEDIVKMKSLAPDAKIVFLLRNPIERAWSQFKHENRDNKNFDINNVNNDKVIAFMNSETQELRSNYIKTLDNYMSVFPKDQILIGFYDAIIEKPKDLLIDIVKFIGGDTEDVTKYCQVEKVDNASKRFKIPTEIESYLKVKYRPMIEELSTSYGNYFTSWLSYVNNEQIIKDNNFNSSLFL